MSNRIREIAKEAGIKMYHDESLSLGYLDTPHKKFAELLIKETLSVVYDEVQYDCDFETADSVVEVVRRHFGIKNNG